MEKNGFVSHVHRKKPKGKPMSDAVRRANAAKSKIRSRVEHVFAEQKARMGLFVRTIGIARATVKIGNGEFGLQHQTTAVPAQDRRCLTAATGETSEPPPPGRSCCPFVTAKSHHQSPDAMALIEVSNFIRARGHAPQAKAGHMTAPGQIGSAA
jgi:hypothetical protein